MQTAVQAWAVSALLCLLAADGSRPAAVGDERPAVTRRVAAPSRASRVVEVAIDFARKQGYKVDDYVPKAQKDDQEWRVVFRRAPPQKPSPGDFFTVYVDDRTLTASRLVPGK